ncbi:hypothetical protein C0J29_31935 (plasmid) [Mycobacterium paragordonae]|uniref:Ribbon-helix-helix protein CopG domain-containing protein n=1 Tax=Mycobacterium paragordonae TaxID=1389713 RepID=A0ABQ1CG63_9MYCO|nr:MULTISPECIES: ribbon-helix-helix domain-containing protein [Mycobacterium]AYE99573.1 hypothetical protein C0J29_31935 [Mycobacterium paragordonae]QNI09746.1 CopG family transcriptional regulator [Mycobacterium kubicae]GFG83206.1 hypothetical protein MPRG_64820 [Mycobacterium paragordonae]
MGEQPVGRPEVGRPVNIRLGDELLAKVDAYAAGEGIKRAEAVRQLVQRALHSAQRSKLGSAADPGF